MATVFGLTDSGENVQNFALGPNSSTPKPILELPAALDTPVAPAIRNATDGFAESPVIASALKRPTFGWEKDYAPRPATEPPLPTYEAAQKHTPNPYDYSGFQHPLGVAARTHMPAGTSLSWIQPADKYPANFPYFVRGRDSVRSYITQLFSSKMAYYDGAMGTMIQKEKLEEEEFRAERFKDWPKALKGNNDMLSITAPQVIKKIYLQYLEIGGSNMIGTNTFSSTTIAQADYGLEDLTYELNYEGARLAREACDEVTAKDPTNPRFVVGAMGPTNRTGSISPDVEDPAARNVTFDELVKAYYEQIVGLMDGGADILMIETIFDTLNAKAAVFAVGEYLEHTGIDVPLFISGTLVRVYVLRCVLLYCSCVYSCDLNPIRMMTSEQVT